MEIADITREVWLDREKECEITLKENYDRVPLLNVNCLDDLKEGHLVKFSGMVQDMFNPDYYIEKYTVTDNVTNERKIKSGKYCDFIQHQEQETVGHINANNDLTSERRTFVIITTPGLNEWVYNYQIERFAVKNTNRELKVATIGNKRPLDTDTISDSAQQNLDAKRLCNKNVSNCDSSTQILSQGHLLNFPLPDATGKVCHVRLYEDWDEVRLNDLVEVVGFLSVNSALMEHGISGDDQNSMEIQTHNPPPSLIPRIHCVSWKKIEHSNCITNSLLKKDEFLHLKKEIHLVLTQLFFGDSIAAEYFIYHLISKVYMSGEMPLGKFTLNISKIPVLQIPQYGKILNEFIKLLIPKSYYLPMTLENMNELTFTPKKDYECDRITSGILQLSKNTHLILDETQLQQGNLHESGVRAISALSYLIQWQKVAYDFNYYPMEFDCDIPVLILSEGQSLLPCDFHVPLSLNDFCVNTFNEIVTAAKHYLNPEFLNKIRTYFTMARFADYKIDDSAIMDIIQNDFVQMRQEGTTNADGLHQLLALGRLICISEGKTVLDSDSWKRACQLEIERKKCAPH